LIRTWPIRNKKFTADGATDYWWWRRKKEFLENVEMEAEGVVVGEVADINPFKMSQIVEEVYHVYEGRRF
jgi:hypothetical protein